jgi:hypothetical protein
MKQLYQPTNPTTESDVAERENKPTAQSDLSEEVYKTILFNGVANIDSNLKHILKQYLLKETYDASMSSVTAIHISSLPKDQESREKFLKHIQTLGFLLKSLLSSQMEFPHGSTTTLETSDQ